MNLRIIQIISFCGILSFLSTGNIMAEEIHPCVVVAIQEHEHCSHRCSDDYESKTNDKKLTEEEEEKYAKELADCSKECENLFDSDTDHCLPHN